MLSSGQIDTAALISHRFDFADFEEAFATAARAHEASKVIVNFA